MKSARQLYALTLAALFLVTVVGFSPAAHAATPTVTKFALPSGSVPVGLAYYSGFVYYASYTYGAIYKVNPGTSTFTYLRANDSAPFNHIYFAMALDSSSGNLWLTRRDTANNGTLPGVSMVSTSTGVEIKVLSGAGEWDGVGVSGSYAYAAVGTTFYKILATSPFTTSTFTISGGAGSYYGMVADGSGNVWFTDILGGKLCEFTGASVTCYSGFSRPSSIAIIGTTGYVTENNANGNFQKVNLSTGGIIGSVSISGTTPYGATVNNGSPIWTSSGGDNQVCVVGPTVFTTVCVNDSEANYFAVSDPSNNVYVSYYGSSGIAEIQGLAPSQQQQPSGCSNPSQLWGCGQAPPSHPNQPYVYPTIEGRGMTAVCSGSTCALSGHVWYFGGGYSGGIPSTQMSIEVNPSCSGVCPKLPASSSFGTLTAPYTTTLNYALPSVQQGAFPWRTNQTFTFTVPGPHGTATIFAQCTDTTQCSGFLFWVTVGW